MIRDEILNERSRLIGLIREAKKEIKKLQTQCPHPETSAKGHRSTKFRNDIVFHCGDCGFAPIPVPEEWLAQNPGYILHGDGAKKRM